MTAAHLLDALSVLSLWVVTLAVHPFGRCWRCWGKGRIFYGPHPGKTRNGKRAKPRKIKICPLCKGVGRRQRTGSKLVHQFIKRVRRELQRQRDARRTATPTEIEE